MNRRAASSSHPSCIRLLGSPGPDDGGPFPLLGGLAGMRLARQLGF